MATTVAQSAQMPGIMVGLGVMGATVSPHQPGTFGLTQIMQEKHLKARLYQAWKHRTNEPGPTLDEVGSSETMKKLWAKAESCEIATRRREVNHFSTCRKERGTISRLASVAG